MVAEDLVVETNDRVRYGGSAFDGVRKVGVRVGVVVKLRRLTALE
jgi:hypothetical protein